MIDIKDKKDCCGCWACANACPKQCITMTEDNEGFRYPVVDAATCIDCGLCEKICPVKNAKAEDTPHLQNGFLLQHKDDKIRQESTSGGAFTAIATWIINQGGIVFGGGYEKNTFTVIHQEVSTINDLAIFRNSKYVQSEMRDCFKRALDYLKTDRWVLFSGTPCQIAGLKNFIRNREYEKLVCVDLVCRGIPSPRILRMYIETEHHRLGGKFSKILFRDKYYGYQYSSFSIYNEDKTKNYHKGIDSNEYLRAFFANLSDRPSCYDCKFKKRYRPSDLTIWDCFPIEQFTNKMDNNGTTRVLVQSKKGAMLMKEISDDVNLIELDPEKLISNEYEMYHSIPMNPKRDQFWKDCNCMDAVSFFDKWFPITFKVKLNAFIRVTLFKLGIYSLIKRIFMLAYVRKDERKH